jgi:serine/threonine-protein kinase RsbW
MIGRNQCHCRMVLQNDLNEIDTIWSAIEKLLKECDLSRRDLFQINMVVDELFTNIVSYAYPDKGKHDIEVNIAVDRKHLIVEFVDEGIEFNPLEYKEPDICESLQKRQEGGLGIHFCKKMMVDFTYERRDGKNRVQFKKRIKKPGFWEKLFSLRRVHGD